MQVQSKRIQITDEIRRAVLDQLEKGVYYGGEQALAFENELAQYTGVSHALVLNSGTSAILVGAISLGIGVGDEVLLPANGYISCAEVICFLGAIPVFCDVEPETGNIAPSSLRARRTNRTKAIFMTHLYGHAVALGEILEFAREHHLATLEVCAHALGGEYQDRKLGSFCDIGVLSLGSKNISVAATGGAILTNRDDLCDQACMIYRHGWQRQPLAADHFTKTAFAASPVAGMYPVDRNSRRPGLNLQLDEIPCAIGRVALKSLDDWTRRRNDVANQYGRLISAAGLPVALPPVKQHVKHAFLHYVVQCIHRDALLEFLNQRGIEALIHYPVPIPKMEYYALHHSTASSHYPVADELSRRILSLPMHPWMTPEEVELVVSTMVDFFDRYATVPSVPDGVCGGRHGR